MTLREERLQEIEQLLKTIGDREVRKRLVREYHDIYEGKETA